MLKQYTSGIIRAHRVYLLNLGTTFASQAVTALSIFILTPLLLERLGKEDFGWYGYLLNIVAFSAMLDFGMNMGLLRRIILEKDAAEKYLNTLFFFFVGIGILAIPAFGALFYSKLLSSRELPWLSGFFVAALACLFLLSYLFDTVINTGGKIYISKSIRIIKLLAELALSLYLLRYNDVYLLLGGAVAVNLLYILALFFAAKYQHAFTLRWSNASVHALADHFRYSRWFFLASLATLITFNGQIFMLASIGGEKKVAQFLIVHRFFEVLRLALTNFTVVLTPRITTLQGEQNLLQIRKIYTLVMLRMSAGLILFFLMLYFWGLPVFQWWSGVRLPEVNQLFYVYAIFIWLIILDSVSAIFLGAMGINRIQTIVALLQGGLSLLLTYLLYPSFGITGLAMASCIALLATNFFFNPLYLWWYLRKHTHAAVAS